MKLCHLKDNSETSKRAEPKRICCLYSVRLVFLRSTHTHGLPHPYVGGDLFGFGLEVDVGKSDDVQSVIFMLDHVVVKLDNRVTT